MLGVVSEGRREVVSPRACRILLLDLEKVDPGACGRDGIGRRSRAPSYDRLPSDGVRDLSGESFCVVLIPVNLRRAVIQDSADGCRLALGAEAVGELTRV